MVNYLKDFLNKQRRVILYMKINKKKKVILIINKVVKNQKGNFTISELKEKIHYNLECRNFKNVKENNEEIEEFIKKLKVNKKLFQYDNSDDKYFYVH